VTGVGNLFFVNYYVQRHRPDQGASRRVKGDLSGGQKALQKALAKD